MRALSQLGVSKNHEKKGQQIWEKMRSFFRDLKNRRGFSKNTFFDQVTFEANFEFLTVLSRKHTEDSQGAS